MTGKSIKYFTLLLAVSIFSLQNNADARRRGIPFLFTTGETYSDYHLVTQEDLNFLYPDTSDEADASAAAAAGVQVSFQYDRFGLFFINLWTWNGKVVLLEEAKETYYDIEVSQAEAIKKYGKPFLYKFPPLLIALVVGGGLWLFSVFGAARVGAGTPARASSGHMPTPGLNPGSAPVNSGPVPERQPIPLKRERSIEEIQAMYDDPRYQHALQLLEETDSFIKPIEYLIANGVPEGEAGPNLTDLKKAIAEAQA